MLDLPLSRHQLSKDFNICPPQITQKVLQCLHNHQGIQVSCSENYSDIEQHHGINNI